MNYVPRHSSVVPARAKAKRAAVIGVATMAAAGGMALASTGSANAAGSVWDRVAACESGGNWSIATGNGFYGGLQFTRQTWLGFGGGAYAPSAHMASRTQQIAIAQRVLAVQGPGAWPVCSRKAGLSRSNGGAAVAVAPASVTVSRSTTRAAIAPKATTARGTVARMQAKVGVKADGVIGRMTIRAIQRHVGVRADGVVGRGTVRAIEVKMHLRLTGGSRLTATHIAALAR